MHMQHHKKIMSITALHMNMNMYQNQNPRIINQVDFVFYCFRDSCLWEMSILEGHFPLLQLCCFWFAFPLKRKKGENITFSSSFSFILHTRYLFTNAIVFMKYGNTREFPWCWNVKHVLIWNLNQFLLYSWATLTHVIDNNKKNKSLTTFLIKLLQPLF